MPFDKISIVTPSYNQGRFLEQTILSVIGQQYPNLEYIVMDGGSTDNSVEIIKKYESQLTHWESEKDRGQAHALNKGFAMATGTIYGWINSDDFYLPGTLSFVAEQFDPSKPDEDRGKENRDRAERKRPDDAVAKRFALLSFREPEHQHG